MDKSAFMNASWFAPVSRESVLARLKGAENLKIKCTIGYNYPEWDFYEAFLKSKSI